MYPLFHAVALPASIDVVKKLHNLNPMAIQDVNLEDLTVLHHACIFRADYKIIKYLVKHYPQACAMKTYSYTTLHSALESSICSVTLAKLLVKTNPDVLHMKTKLKETPNTLISEKCMQTKHLPWLLLEKHRAEENQQRNNKISRNSTRKLRKQFFSFFFCHL